MKIGNREFTFGKKVYVMGILNCTPDSFSDGGKYNNTDQALMQTERMIAEGAALIDVGGESTRPGHVRISDEEEISRVLPVIREIKRRFDIPLSIDSYKSEVIKAALDAGADMVNDIWGLKKDKKAAEVTAKYGVPVCLMHNRENTDYKDFLGEVCSDLRDSVQIAEKAGIKREKIILDPGVGFAKSHEQNLQIIRHLNRLKELGFPVMLAASKKRVIGLTLDLPVDERLEGTIAVSVIGAMEGCDFIRVHDIKENIRALWMAEAVMNA